MPKRSGQITLTDIRRRYDAERLLVHRYIAETAHTLAAAWQIVFPESTANLHCAHTKASRLVTWYYRRFPEAADGLRHLMVARRRLRRFIFRTESERRGFEIIRSYVVFRYPLEECWRLAVPESPANPNSARILAQRYASRLIRKHPDVHRRIIETLHWQGLCPVFRDEVDWGAVG